jgi:hypothetical protein
MEVPKRKGIILVEINNPPANREGLATPLHRAAPSITFQRRAWKWCQRHKTEIRAFLVAAGIIVALVLTDSPTEPWIQTRY